MKLASVLVASLCLLPAAGRAQGVTSEDLIRQLSPTPAPRPATRGLGDSIRGGAERGSGTRAIVVVPGHQDEVIAAKAGLPSANLRVPFDYNSATLTPKGREMLTTLAKALQDSKLQSFKFLIGGHTDAKGSDDFNQSLSDRRAAAVKEFLITSQHVAPERLEAMGFGKRQLADPAKPEDGVNRRVEIVNLTK